MPRAASLARFLHGGAIFLGAFLLFEVQLVVAKAILPSFGGAPAVWTTCMLFFQSLLVAGYAFAHASTRWLSARMQAGPYALLLVLAVLAVLAPPSAPDVSESASAAPVLRILAYLARTLALPCFVLCASSPLLQAWAAREHGRASDGAYRLYALSNAGSMLALLGYPLAVEPWLTTHAQERAWSAAFAVFALLAATCAWRTWSAPVPPAGPTLLAAPEDERASAPTPRRRLTWLALSACASTLLLAVTNQMCQEVAVVPLLWVLPLALYLFSFVLCFGSERGYARAWCLPVLILTLAVMAQAAAMGARVGIAYAVPVYSLGLFVCCWFCHGELAARRPAARHLTSFYLLVAFGGALGAVFVSVLAPLVFRGFDELLVGLLACGLLATGFALGDPSYRRAGRGAWHPMVPALVLVAGVLALLFGLRVLNRARPGLIERRDFYGIVRIEDLRAPEGEGGMRYLTHGGTRHGQQYQDSARRAQPTAYYGHPSGIGIVLDELDERAELASRAPLRVGIVGLGAGTLATYGRAGDTYRFYELSPMVIDVAEHEFTFLGDSAATIELVPGDARLSLAREADQRFDVLVLDAFSSDAIPVHLLTAEAFALYARHLAPGGVLALHATTRHLDLGPLIRALADASGQTAWEIRSPDDDAAALLAARWILLTSDPERLTPRIRAAGHALDTGARTLRAWTDDYSNLLQVLE